MQNVAVVIGGTGHLGKALTSRLLRAGCDVAVVARGQDPSDAFDHPSSDGRGRVSVLGADVTDERQVHSCMREARTAFGHINFLIYSAGFEPDMDVPLAQYSTASWHQTLDTYLTGFFLCFREGLQWLGGQNGAHIVAVSSAITRFTEDTLPEQIFAGHYAAAKAGLNMLVRWGRREAHQKGILLSRVSPSALDNPFHENAPAYRRPKAVLPADVLASRIVEALLEQKEIDVEIVGSCAIAE